MSTPFIDGVSWSISWLERSTQLHSLYVFDFLQTVSVQLKQLLMDLDETRLDEAALQELARYQRDIASQHGVYVVHYNGAPVYVGKADNVADRLAQHLAKLRGRKGIVPEAIGYKALALDKSMSTAANEKILIEMFKKENKDMWNGAGFGPKDPGKERDTTKPGKFDQAYPILDQFPLKLELDARNGIKLADMFVAMKAQLPYVFRYDVPADELEKVLVLPDLDRSARRLLQAAVSLLGPGWKGAIISYGMVLYKTTKHYPYGEEITP